MRHVLQLYFIFKVINVIHHMTPQVTPRAAHQGHLKKRNIHKQRLMLKCIHSPQFKDIGTSENYKLNFLSPSHFKQIK